MSEQLTLIEEAFALTVVEGENLQLTLDGGNGPAGPAGPAGPSGSGSITTSSTTNFDGYIFGNGSNIAGATAAASAATPSTLVVRTSGGAASFTGITNNGLLTLSTGTTFSYGTGIAAAHRTALGLGTLATQSGTFSGDSSGTNTGDQDLVNLLPRVSSITVSGTTPAFPDPLVEQPSLINGKRWWSGTGSSLEFNGTDWLLHYYDGVMDNYDATLFLDSTEEPWKVAPASWTLVNGTGEPTLSIDPPTLLPLSGASGTIALASDQQGHVAPSDMIGLGSGVAGALAFASDTQNGFLTAGTGGTLPVSRGGTGSTTSPLARTALGSGATGDALFTAASASAARTTLGAGTTGGALFTAATPAAAYTALNVSEIAGVGPVVATLQNTDINVGSSISVVAGTYLIEINATFANASSSSGNFRLQFGSNPFTVNPQRIGPAIVNEIASTAFYGDNTGVGYVGGTNATTPKCSVWASGILTFSGSNSIQLRVRNTAVGGTVTCDAYRMTVKKIA